MASEGCSPLWSDGPHCRGSPREAQARGPRLPRPQPPGSERGSVVGLHRPALPGLWELPDQGLHGIPCLARWILNRWTTREGLIKTTFNSENFRISFPPKSTLQTSVHIIQYHFHQADVYLSLPLQRRCHNVPWRTERNSLKCGQSFSCC